MIFWCGICLEEAHRRALMNGGRGMDYYPDVLAEIYDDHARDAEDAR